MAVEPEQQPQTPSRNYLGLSSPIGVIGAFTALSEIAMIFAVTQTSGGIQITLLLFSVVFPLLVAGGFFIILYHRPQHLYSPREYGEPATAGELAEAFALGRGPQEKLTAQATVSMTGNVSIVEDESEREEPLKELTAVSAGESEVETTRETAFARALTASPMDFDAAEEAFRAIQAEEDDEHSRATNKLVYEYYRFKNGDRNALKRLEDLAQNAQSAPDWAWEPHTYLGLAYQLAGSHAKAESSFRSALVASKTEVQRANAVTHLATSQFRQEQTDSALATFEEAIRSTSDSAALAVLYEALASHYEETKEHESRAFALEKALENRPDDTDLRFEAALAYGEAGFPALSLSHYQILLQTSPNNEGALNNAGVSFASLNMPIKAVDSYQAAYALGNTLSAANLAHLYLRAGFVEDASELLDEAMQMENPHPNVAGAIARISTNKEADDLIEKDTLKSAREQRVFFLAFAEQRFASSGEDGEFVGEWQSDEGYRVSITREEGKTKAAWTAGKKNYSFTASVDGSTAKLSEIRARDAELKIWTYGELVADSGYAYLSDDSRTLTIMRLKSGEPSFTRLNRIDPTS